jgi:putative tricarboxylic transport membrane protein
MALLAALIPSALSAAAEFTPSGPVSISTQSGPGGGNDVFGQALIAAMDAEPIATPHKK